MDVKRATLGFLKQKLLPAERALAAATTPEESVDRVVDIVLLYVGHTEGVDAQFILDNAEADGAAVIRACAIAAGQRVPEGEAKSQ